MKRAKKASSMENGSGPEHADLAGQCSSIDVVQAGSDSFDRTELVRLLTQCIADLGYERSADLLQKESGIVFQAPCVNNFRDNVR